jgi:hypothetical protein
MKTNTQSHHLGPQRARTPGYLVFSLQNSSFGGPPEGAMIATMDPGQADAVIVGQGYAPLWEYFSRLLRQTSSLLPPKDTDRELCGFSPANAALLLGRRGAMIRFMDPS